jgi:hypothetical protein
MIENFGEHLLVFCKGNKIALQIAKRIKNLRVAVKIKFIHRGIAG